MLLEQRVTVKVVSWQEELPGLDAQLMSNGEDRLQDRHEAGDLTEAAAAHHLGMHRKALLRASCVHTSGNLDAHGQRRKVRAQGISFLPRTFPFSPCWHHYDALRSGGHMGMVVRWRGGVD